MLPRASRSTSKSLSCVRKLHSATFVSDSRWPGWQAVIGIETHAQIKSRRKLFSDTYNAFDEPSNTRVSLFDAAFPGTLPILNSTCVNLGVRTALALDADVHATSYFDRKHYFYADLPNGYQITQKYAPLAKNGRLQITPEGRTVGIEQIQLEQDTAKSTRATFGDETYVDLNRAGAGLMEIVSQPDMRTPEEAGAYVRALRAVLRAVGASDGNMEQGSLRCDINVSVNREGEPFGVRCEVKNLNSVRFLTSAIICEIYRHIDLLSRGCPVVQETRGYNEESAETYSLRSKEDAPDYRYMPDPNIPPLILSESYITSIADSMPELPQSLSARLQAQYGISDHDINSLIAVDAFLDIGLDGEESEDSVVRYFERVAEGRDPKTAINWIAHELLGQLAHRNHTFQPSLFPVGTMRELIDSVTRGDMTGTSAKTLLRHILDNPSSLDVPFSSLIDFLSLRAASAGNSGALRELCQGAIDALPKEAASARKGNEKVIMRLVGQVMKSSRGTADAKAVAALLKEMLLP